MAGVYTGPVKVSRQVRMVCYLINIEFQHWEADCYKYGLAGDAIGLGIGKEGCHCGEVRRPDKKVT